MFFSMFIKEEEEEEGGREEEEDGNMHRVRLPPEKGKEGEGGREEGVFRGVVSEQLLPTLKKFAPQLILFSWGLEVVEEDEEGREGGMGLGGREVGWVIRQVQGVADLCCGGKMVCVMEGGREGGREGEAVVALVKGLVDP